jgi:hypothetical protein
MNVSKEGLEKRETRARCRIRFGLMRPLILYIILAAYAAEPSSNLKRLGRDETTEKMVLYEGDVPKLSRWPYWVLGSAARRLDAMGYIQVLLLLRR